MTGDARSPPSAEAAPNNQSASHRLAQARRLATILTNRDWELLYECVRLLQLECAETLGACIAPAAYGRVRPESSCPEGEAARGTGGGGGGDACVHEEADDEALLVRLLRAFDDYSRWLGEVSSTLGQLGCLVAAQRGNEMLDVQNTPTLPAGGLASFRSAVVLHPSISAALRRHVARAEASLLRHGGWTPESGRLMQTLIDLDSCLSRLDVRDDHLSEERGLAPSQQRLRDSLVAPLRACWQRHATQWFCGTRIAREDLTLYVGGGGRGGRAKRRRNGGLIYEDPSCV